MKNQQTVEKNFESVIQTWRISQKRKSENVRRAQKQILEKVNKLKKEYDRLDVELRRIQAEAPPQVPTGEFRKAQREKSISRLEFD